MSTNQLRYSPHQAAAQLAIVQSVTRILWQSVAVVSATELAVMLVLKVGGHPITLWTSLLDTLLLSSIALPALYALILRPVVRLAAGHAAAASQEQFETIAAAVQDGIVIFDSGRIIRFANAAAERMHGYAPGALPGKPVEILMSEKEAQGMRQNLPIFLRTGQSAVISKGPVEVEGLRSDGTQVALELAVSPLQQGREMFFVAVLREITERKRVEREMARLAAFPQLNPNPVLECEPDGRITLANPAARNLLETAAAPPDNAQALIPDFQRLAKIAFQENAEVDGIESQHGNRTLLWCLQPEPHSRRLHAYAMDITARKLAENSVMESEWRLRQVLDALPLGVHILQNERIAFANNADARIFGFDRAADIVGLDPFQNVAPEEVERLRDYARRRAAGEDAPRHYETRVRRRDGDEVHVRIHAERILFEGAPASMVVVEDLTERQRLQMYEQILPVCCVCGKIRNDQGVERGQGPWERLDHYVASHSDAQVSHTFCPQCLVEYRRREGIE